MSLTDTDKSSANRSQPSIGGDDGLAGDVVKAHATDGIAYRASASASLPRVVQRDDQIIVHDGTTNKALFGRDGTGAYVVKVAKDGYDVLTATGDQLIFNSENNLFKIVSTGVISVSHVHTANSARTTSVAHGQSGRPTILMFANNLVAPGVPAGPSYQMPFTYPAVSGGDLVISTLMQGYVDATNITVYSWSANATTITADVRYYVIQETAS